MGQLEDALAKAIIEANDRKFCLTSEFVEFAQFRRREPRHQPRMAAWWEVAEIHRERRRSAERIRAMTGDGKLIYQRDKQGNIAGGPTGMSVCAEIQPETPQEHDILEAVRKHHRGVYTAAVKLIVEGGTLKASFILPVPELEAVKASEHPEGRSGIVLKADADQRRVEEKAAREKAEEEAKAKAQADAKAKAEAK